MTPERHANVERWIDRHFAGRLEPRHEREMRAHLTNGCSSCRRHYDSHLLIGMIDPAALSAEERLARALSLARPPRRWLLPVAIGAAVAAACLLLILRVPSRSVPAFASRGASGGDVSLTTYSITAGRAPELVAGRMVATGELAFAYSNAAGKRHVMVLGIDEHRHVYWYHPAWIEEGTNPSAIPAAAGPGPHELPDAVSHRIDGYRLTIFGLFMDGTLDVRSVERAVESWEGTGPLPFDPALGVIQTHEDLEVTP